MGRGDEARRSSSKRRSRRNRRSEEDVAFMGEEDEAAAGAGDTAAAADDGADAGADAGGDDAAPADGGDAGADAGDAGADDAGGDDDATPQEEAAEMKEDLADGQNFDDGEIDDDEKAKRYASKMSNKSGVKSRVKLYKMCNMFEAAAAELLSYALNNPMEKENALSRRSELLQALYYLRHISDIDDDFQQEEFETEMKNIKVFRSKMQRLAAKEDEFKESDASDSSDDELDDDDMEILKESRKLMEFAFGKEAKEVQS